MKSKLTVVLLSGLTFFFTSVAIAGLLDKSVDFSTLPTAVQETITQNSEGGKVESVEQKLLEKDGLKVYEVEVKKTDGTELELKVDENGKLLEMEKD